MNKLIKLNLMITVPLALGLLSAVPAYADRDDHGRGFEQHQFHEDRGNHFGHDGDDARRERFEHYEHERREHYLYNHPYYGRPYYSPYVYNRRYYAAPAFSYIERRDADDWYGPEAFAILNTWALANFDVYHRGYLEPWQYQRARFAFWQFADHDHDGHISSHEWHEFCEHYAYAR